MVYRAYKTRKQFSCFTESLINCILSPWHWLYLTHYNLESAKHKTIIKKILKNRGFIQHIQVYNYDFQKNTCKKNTCTTGTKWKPSPHFLIFQVSPAINALCMCSSAAVQWNALCQVPLYDPRTFSLDTRNWKHPPQEGKSILQYNELTPSLRNFFLHFLFEENSLNQWLNVSVKTIMWLKIDK